MTIDAAIKYYNDLADDIDKNSLIGDDSAETRQLVEWLEELKAIKESAVFYSNRPIEDIVLEARNDAIDECIAIIGRKCDEQDLYLPIHIRDILEQLKEGENNGKTRFNG